MQADQPVQLTVAPNPNSGRFTLFLEGKRQPGELTIYDAAGKLVWCKPVPATATGVEVDVQQDRWVGFYLAKFRHADGAISVAKIVVQR